MFFFGSTILAVVALRFVPVYFTPLMFIRCFEQMGRGESVKLHHEWVPMERISRHMPVAVMASEDQRFLLHHGFDYDAIEKAARSNLKGGKSEEAARYHSRRPKTCFFGPAVRGCARGLRLISLCS